ncbi:MAG: hypothetical protein N3E46_04090 [Gemmataceae bacterium]|nr:hypothetical protein [Gemmataceae bacterium]
MTPARHLLLLTILSWGGVLLTGCTPPGQPPDCPESAGTDSQADQSPPANSLSQSGVGKVEATRTAAALRQAVMFLRQHQDQDGAWRSDLYAVFKDGSALTPLVLLALQHAYDVDPDLPDVLPTLQRGYRFLARWSQPDGTLGLKEDQLEYPVYTAALTLEVFSHATAQEMKPLRQGWVRYLLQRQLTEANGWKPEDDHYGGWGYCRLIPYKPEPGKFAPAHTESNLSATLFALQGLAQAEALDTATARKALVFIRRMQNWGSEVPSHVRDGGFRFVPGDPVRNKAGLANPPLSTSSASSQPAGPGFPSYGSMTADGYRALALCHKVQATDPQLQDDARLRAAADWLLRHFQAAEHPGAYIPDHASNRNAVYYYYASSLARAFAEHRLVLPGQRHWAHELAQALLNQQKPDGRWENPLELVRENEPLVATAQAVIALALCHKNLQVRR